DSYLLSEVLSADISSNSAIIADQFTYLLNYCRCREFENENNELKCENVKLKKKLKQYELYYPASTSDDDHSAKWLKTSKKKKRGKILLCYTNDNSDNNSNNSSEDELPKHSEKEY
ncbi:5688_t:CDS:2, partial [Funneliformis caledonium]